MSGGTHKGRFIIPRMRGHDYLMLNWYEDTLPAGERKRRGHFSTPPGLIEQILDACGYTPERDLSLVRVLDPACGSGNFLTGAARRLVAFGKRRGLAHEVLENLVQRNLWGFDPDPIACFLAEMQLRTVLLEGSRLEPPTRFHIHQADGLGLPWEPCVDLFVMNPPYLAAKNHDLSGYRSTRRQPIRSAEYVALAATAALQSGIRTGQSDSYLLFLNVALQAVRPSGWIGVVLPDPILARANAARERACLLEHFTLHHLWHLSGVFAAQVGAVVLIAQKCPPKTTHQVVWMRQRWQNVGAQASSRSSEREEVFIVPSCTSTVPQSLFLNQPGAEFRYLLSSAHGATIERLRHSFDLDNRVLPGTATNGSGQRYQVLAPLSRFLSISRGEELGRDHPTLVHSKEGSPSSKDGTTRWYPLLRGGVDVHPYGAPTSNWWIARPDVTKPLERYLAPKLLVVKSTGRLQAALDLQGHVALQTLYLLHLREQDADDLYFFLALLNSSLLRQYVYMLYTAYKWVQPQIEQHVLAQLPIPAVSPDEKREINSRAKLLMQLSSQADAGADNSDTSMKWQEHINDLYEEQERTITRLYDGTLNPIPQR